MNEILFLVFSVFLLGLGLVAFRAGKQYIFILIAVYSLLMNIFVLKQFTLFGWMVTGGNALYGAIFLLTDLLSEHYGKREAFRSVWIGFGVSALFVITTQVLLAFIPNEFDFAQDSLQTLFSVTPRILLGSMLAYVIAQNLDVWLFTAIRTLTGDRWLWLRNNGSTLLSQLVDTIIFTSVGLTTFSWLPFEGVITMDIFWPIVWATYGIKVIVAALDTPFLYMSYWLKRD